MGSGIRCHIWKWEIVNPDDPDQNNGTKLLTKTDHMFGTFAHAPQRSGVTENNWVAKSGFAPHQVGLYKG
ncbi:hypothetical protein TNCV_1144581 [Trichonephila clavipes]|nr:hypothetical protein TNCV_1144581 [Trichonephila clavipes]